MKIFMNISNILRIVFWGIFLVCLIVFIGIPVMSLYGAAEFTARNVVGEFLANIVFSGFFVIVAFEYFHLRYITAQIENSAAALLAISPLIPVTYYVVSVFGAHVSILLQLSFYISWFFIIYLVGRLFKSNLKEQEILKRITIFALVGTAILLTINVAWTFIYSEFLRPNRLELTPYFMVGSGVLSWVLLLFLLLYAKRNFALEKP